jgi:hypothetical protein
MIYRPFHLEYAKKIINTYFINEDNILVNHYPSGISTTGIGSDITLINITGGAFNKVKEIRKVRKQLLEQANHDQKITIFIPHTLGILSNYSFFKLAGHYKNVKVNIFYEGIIIFYDYEHGYLKNAGYYISRWALSLLSGISYTINKKLLDLKSQKIDKIYTPFVDIDAPEQKIVEMPFDKIDYEPQQDSCIILGLRLERTYDEDVRKIIVAMYQMVKEENIKNIYFKDHPSEKNELFNVVADEMGLTLILINDTSPIENIIGRYKPKYVMSIWSSGIINLKYILPASTFIYCFITKKMINNAQQKQIVDVFEKQGIIIKYS